MDLRERERAKRGEWPSLPRSGYIPNASLHAHHPLIEGTRRHMLSDLLEFVIRQEAPGEGCLLD
jgi:hypothetical protein